MHAVVTGVAGFIGSHLAERLVADGDEVLGIDCFTDYYDRSVKEANLTALRRSPTFELVETDLRHARLEDLIHRADVVFHQAGQPGVRNSFASGFPDYCGHNILATQRLLEAAKAVSTPRFVFASSSSVYGNALRYPTSEEDLPRPFSPYGVTKLAAEHLCTLYAENWGVPTVSLRYFTVYGPRQRPDMAMHRLIAAILGHRALHALRRRSAGSRLHLRRGRGQSQPCRGEQLHQARLSHRRLGGSSVTMLEVVELAGRLAGLEPRVDHIPAQPGDVRRTGGAATRSRELLGWGPTVSLRDGLAAQVEWAVTTPATGTPLVR